MRKPNLKFQMANSCVVQSQSWLSTRAGRSQPWVHKKTSVCVEEQCSPSARCSNQVTADRGSLKCWVSHSTIRCCHLPKNCTVGRSMAGESRLSRNCSSSSQHSFVLNSSHGRWRYATCLPMNGTSLDRMLHNGGNKKTIPKSESAWLDSCGCQHCPYDDPRSICRRRAKRAHSLVYGCAVPTAHKRTTSWAAAGKCSRNICSSISPASSELCRISAPSCLAGNVMIGFPSQRSGLRSRQSQQGSKWGGRCLTVTAGIHSDDQRPLSSSLADIVANADDVSATAATMAELPALSELQCVETGTGDVSCVLVKEDGSVVATTHSPATTVGEATAASADRSLAQSLGEVLLLMSPFFFWGTSMVVMKGILPKVGPLFIASVRLIPAGMLIVGFATWQKRKMPAGALAWGAIALFALVDGTLFQGFLAEGLQRTSAGLGSVIIDSQPLTVAVLASLLFGESLGPLGVLGLLLGVIGLCLIEVPLDALLPFFKSSDVLSAGASVAGSSTDNTVVVFRDAIEQLGSQERSFLWEAGEFWMLLAAQSMAVGTVMVRWVCKYNDSIMATGWHLILGGMPLLLLSLANQEPALSGGPIADFGAGDIAGLLYASVFGSAISYAVFFYNANRGSLTKLSALTFLTPMFATLFGYVFLGETLSQVQLVGAATTLIAVMLVNIQPSTSDSNEGVPSKDD